MTSPQVSAVVLAYGAEPWLEASVQALLASTDACVEVVLVDNGCTDGAVARLRGTPGVVHVGDGTNLGFSAGCNLGVQAASADRIALVNGDLVVRPDAVAELVRALEDPAVAIAGGSIRLGDDPELLNSAGNTIHFLGFSWCGGFGEPASRYAEPRELATAMGALVAFRRSTWDDLGGFAEEYFANHEDVDLCWRARQRGYRVVHVPASVGTHRYEFGRTPRKMYFSERNRLIFVLTCFERSTLALLAPVAIVLELAIALMALRHGWFRQKAEGWWWLWRNRAWLRRRRHLVQRERTVSDRDLAHLLTTHLTGAANFPLPDYLGPLDAMLAAYWAVVRRMLPDTTRRLPGT
jgi:GT2 family glycosyltransferase